MVFSTLPLMFTHSLFMLSMLYVPENRKSIKITIDLASKIRHFHKFVYEVPGVFMVLKMTANYESSHLL